MIPKKAQIAHFKSMCKFVKCTPIVKALPHLCMRIQYEGTCPEANTAQDKADRVLQ